MGIMQAAAKGPKRASLPTSTSVLATNPGGACSASVNLTNGGVYSRTTSPGSTTTIQNWIVGGSGLVSQYEARWTTLTGSLSSGTAGSWVSLSSTQTWTRSAGAGADLICTGTLEIRHAATGIVSASCAVSLEANGSP